MATRDTVSKALVLLATAYPRYEMTKDTGRVYAELLSDIPDDLLIAAAKHHATISKWFPSVAELRAAAFSIQAKVKGVPSAEEAWGEVMHQIRNIGSWGEPQFSTPLIGTAVDGLGGWMIVCTSTNTVADRAHFLRIYGNLLKRQQEDVAMLPEVRELIRGLTTPLLEESCQP
jgi:hypothetical protein